MSLLLEFSDIKKDNMNLIIITQNFFLNVKIEKLKVK